MFSAQLARQFGGCSLCVLNYSTLVVKDKIHDGQPFPLEIDAAIFAEAIAWANKPNSFCFQADFRKCDEELALPFPLPSRGDCASDGSPSSCRKGRGPMKGSSALFSPVRYNRRTLDLNQM
ncbi:hypothetical protein DUNSADRAFT_15653 [Dunaliella salina]|uniref:Encoded protein n=1 Tax=Dunaliella salina TaxID=3046 RepID=A0ABQ7G517_DUNSA|nr:hypothetical protein DUNSADRAFT_15653 [Dunaliella salina]|eukprot:KAF5829697.1 hypothetical protein DUNSADRAFT_15653 [Dunaliella salina]